jgi:hypothetical protein
VHRFYYCSTILITACRTFERLDLYLSLFASFACTLRSLSLTAVWVAIDDERIIHLSVALYEEWSTESEAHMRALRPEL